MMSVRWEKASAAGLLRNSTQHYGFPSKQRKQEAKAVSGSRQKHSIPQKENSNPMMMMESSSSSPSGNGSKGSKKKHKRTASLTDLRPEDKKKVANLIQELANLGSQKEKIESQLRKERQDFEGAIKDLVSDQKSLLHERQAVQTELNSCQQMLNQLQEAVLHRPKLSSALSSERDVEDITPRSDIVPGKTKAEFDRSSALDEYISNHNSTQEAMEVCSDVGSVISDAVRNPRTSSTIIEPPTEHRRRRQKPDMSRTDTSIRSNSTVNSTIDYSRKDELFVEKAKLIEEQRQLRQRLLEQEELLRQTQHRLYLQEQRQSVNHQTHSSTGFGMNGQHQATSQLMPPPPPQFAENMNRTYTTDKPTTLATQHTPVRSPLHMSGGDTGSYRPPTNMSYSVGIQVTTPEPVSRTSSMRHTQDHSAQTELPVQTKCYIGNRLVPSPSTCVTRSNSSMEETIEKTSRLLQSARKIIDEAKTPSTSRTTASSKSSASSQGSKKSPVTVCTQHSYQAYTPRKTPQELFDMTDATLASEMNSDSMMNPGGGAGEPGDADRTELELLEDIFYVR